MRIALSLLAAFVANFVVVMGFEALLGVIYPMPAGLDPNDPTQLAEYARAMPTGAFVGLLAGWTAGAFAAAAAAFLVSGRVAWTAWAGAAFNLLGVVVSIAMLPHPIWVAAAGVSAPVAAALLVPRLLRPRAPADAG